MKCPECNTPILAKHIYAGNGNMSKCPNCRSVLPLTLEQKKNIIQEEYLANFDIHKPPSGSRIHQDEKGLKINVIQFRSSSLAFLLASVLTIGVFGLSYHENFIVHSPKTEIYFVMLFLILMAVLFIANTAVLLFGKMTLHISDNKITLFRGLGNLGTTSFLKIDSITDISIENTSSSSQKKEHSIVIRRKNKKDLKFGSHLHPLRRNYFFNSLLKIMYDHRNGIDFTQQDLSDHLLE